MQLSFGLPLMLLGLAGVAIPIIIHLLNRRRFQVIDWGAMQFLQISETRRRRLLLEELLLLALRMGLVALIVFGLAAPLAESPAFAKLGVHSNRDVVLLIDGSYSMGYGSKTAHDAARSWAIDFVAGLIAGDAVAVLQAKQQVLPIVGSLSHDLERVRAGLRQLPPPRGGVDWPSALQSAEKLLAASQRAEQEIIVLTDGQRFGWADDGALLRWELLGRTHSTARSPRIWVVNLDPNRPADPLNWSLEPVQVSRAVSAVGQQITFRTAIRLHGKQEYRPPHRLRLEVDQKFVRDLEAPGGVDLQQGQVPISFTHRFLSSGSHLVSLVLEPDPPPEQRPPGYVLKDLLAGDNRQDVAVEVLAALPVLLVEGDAQPSSAHHGTDFLRDALSPTRDPSPAVRSRVVKLSEFGPPSLAQDVGPGRNTNPRVLVLSDVPRLLTPQQEAVDRFLKDGGGLLVTLGQGVDPRHYNDALHRGSDGWLPARLLEVAGDLAKPDRGVSPLPSSFFHTALELFKETSAGGLSEARFPRWHKVVVPGKSSATSVALLSNQDPWLVERAYQAGRVMMCTVPLDRSWGSNLPNLTAFAPLAHELVFYLAGARSAEHNLDPGQPIRYRLQAGETVESLLLQPPDAPARRLVLDESDDPATLHAQLVQQPSNQTLMFDQTRETGVYRLISTGGRVSYFVVQPDPRESDLTPCSPADRERVAKLVPMTYENDHLRVATSAKEAQPRQEIWAWFLLGVTGLLCGEIWMTRRMARNRA